MSEPRYQVQVCRGPECGDRRGSAALLPAFAAALAQASLEARVDLGGQSCFGRCSLGPNVLVRELRSPAANNAVGPGPRRATALYSRVDVARAHQIVREHVAHGRVLVEAPGAPRSELT